MYTKHLCCMLLVPRASPPYTNSILYFETQTNEQQSPSNNWLALAGWPARLGDRSAVPSRAHRSKHALQLICIALSYIISADLRSTHISRAYCTPEACMAAHACALAVAPCLHYAILFRSLPHFEEMQATQSKHHTLQQHLCT